MTKEVPDYGHIMQHIDTLFLDRDGTLIVECHYLHDPDQVQLIPDVTASMRILCTLGVRFFLVSNQSGIGRGFFTTDQYLSVHNRLETLLAQEGIRLSGSAFCPHSPEQNCACRKPRIGLWQQLCATHSLRPETTMMIGDKKADIGFGQAVGCAATALVHTGHGLDQARLLGLPALTQPLALCPAGPGWPTLQAHSLADVLSWLVQHKRDSYAHRI